MLDTGDVTGAGEAGGAKRECCFLLEIGCQWEECSQSPCGIVAVPGLPVMHWEDREQVLRRTRSAKQRCFRNRLVS